MHLLTEAEGYADDYEKCTDSLMKEMYRSMSMGHLDMYNNIVSYINRFVSQNISGNYNYKDVWSFLKDYQNELYTKIKKRL